MAGENNNDLVAYDYGIICVEVLFKDGDIPYDTYKVGSISGLADTLSGKFLAAEAKKNHATSAFVQNIYCRANTEDRKNRLEFRIGDTLELDIEAISFKEE